MRVELTLHPLPKWMCNAKSAMPELSAHMLLLQLTWLDLGNNNMTGTLPDSWSSLSQARQCFACVLGSIMLAKHEPK